MRRRRGRWCRPTRRRRSSSVSARSRHAPASRSSRPSSGARTSTPRCRGARSRSAPRWPRWRCSARWCFASTGSCRTRGSCRRWRSSAPGDRRAGQRARSRFGRLFIRSDRMEEEVHQRAQVVFLARELFATPGRDAILVLVSLFERHVVVIPDAVGAAGRRPGVARGRRADDAVARAGTCRRGVRRGCGAIEELLAGRAARAIARAACCRTRSSRAKGRAHEPEGPPRGRIRPEAPQRGGLFQ